MPVSADFNLNALKETYDRSCFLARLHKYISALKDNHDGPRRMVPIFGMASIFSSTRAISRWSEKGGRFSLVHPLFHTKVN
jgi:hypothetical protein